MSQRFRGESRELVVLGRRDEVGPRVSCTRTTPIGQRALAWRPFQPIRPAPDAVEQSMKAVVVASCRAFLLVYMDNLFYPLADILCHCLTML